QWDKRTQIPSDRVRFGNFDRLTVLSEHRVHAIAGDAAAGKLTDKDGAKIGAAYSSFMNAALADKLGAKPVQPQLARIRAVKSKGDLATLMGQGVRRGFASVLPVGISIDAKDPNHYAVLAGTGGLGLPDRDYYLQPAFAAKKAKYQAYVQQMLSLA